MSDIDLDIPSNRIRFALEAMREVEARDGFEIDMTEYRFIEDTICYACCGGAARIKRDNLWSNPISANVSEVDEFEESLDAARTGEIASMFGLMGLEVHEGAAFNRIIRDYTYILSSYFYSEMNKLADDLEGAGY